MDRSGDQAADRRPPAGEAAAGWRPPAAFDEYEIVRPLGHGHVGMVFLALDTLLDRHVAIKFIPALDDASLGRFLREARAAARIQHPNVASLYRVGQLDGRPYLVSELVRGVGLDRMDRPMEPARVLGIALDLTRGLAAAHRCGVLHRDIKPGNAILAHSGEAKLVDFGLAKILASGAGPAPGPGAPSPREAPAAALAGAVPSSRLSPEDEEALLDLTAGQLIGTPYFMSPEAWRREDITERSDLYSLGLLLYELLAGRGPFRTVPLAALPGVVISRDAPPLASAAPAVPEGLAASVDRCLLRDPDRRFARAEDLLAALEALRPARTGAPVPQGNPYRGLRPFEPEHRALFFGRQRALVHALDRLRAEPLLVVTGDSGVGKSSVCAAGLLPLVSEGGLEDGTSWRIARLVPGRSPAQAVAAALGPVAGMDPAALLALVEDDPAALGRRARGALPTGTGLLVYVDQLEELVTLAAAGEAAQVAEALGSLAAGLPGVRLLATARSDFLSRLEALPGLRDRVSRGLFLLAPLGRDEMREAIVGPARVAGGRYQSDALVDRLVESTATAGGGLPLLQFALAELWQRRDPETGEIQEQALADLGGVEGALSRHADGLLATLLPPQRAAARALLLRLVTVERTRARRLEQELLALSPDAHPVLEALVRGRLLVAGETPDGTTYEIAHEALVQGWSTLAGWLSEEAETRALVGRIELAAGEWHRHHRTRDLLWHGRQLAEISAAAFEALTAREREFVQASRAAERRRRWLRRAAVLAVAAACAVAWAGARLASHRQLERQIAAAEARADASLTAAQALATRLARDRADAFRTFDAGATGAGEKAWRQVQALETELRGRYGDASDSLERALLLDADRADLRRRYGRVLYGRALLAEQIGRSDECDDLVRRMFLYDDDGSLGARWQAKSHLDLTSDPPGAEVTLYRYRPDARGHLVARQLARLGAAPLARIALEPGSYLLELALPGRPVVREPLLAGRGESLVLAVPIPAAAEVPDGFVWIPPGRTLYGSSAEESLRAFFNAVPQHPRQTGGYFIARHETTFAEWLSYLDALPPAERSRRTVGGAQGGTVALTRDPAGTWHLVLHLGATTLSAPAGQPVRYPERATRAEQDWLRMPVVGISFDDAREYAAWLDRTGRVPGARLCSELEWERAARGADRRNFPAGDTLAPDDANFDLTYGKRSAAFGPDEVGSHPAGRSPFSVDDMAGNVWELVVGADGKPVARGGAFDYRASTARISNRETPEREYRDVSLGVRLCASRTKDTH